MGIIEELNEGRKEARALEPHIDVHDVPFEKIVCNNKDGYQLSIEFDDINEIRYRIDFFAYTALKFVTFDCLSLTDTPIIPDHGMMFEVLDSDWISQLKDKSEYEEPTKRKYKYHLMDDQHHYFMYLGDYVAEIVARGYKLERLDEKRE